MNNTFSLEQMAKTGHLNADLILRQHKLKKMAKFKEIKSINPKLKQPERAKELAISTSTLQRYRRGIILHSPYRIIQSSKTNTRKQKTSNHTEHDLKMTSNDLKMTSNDLKKTSNKPVKIKRTKLKGGNPNINNATHRNILIEPAFCLIKWQSLLNL